MTFETALELVNRELGIAARVTVSGRQLKGVIIDHEDGGTGKSYWHAGECARLSEAFAALSAGLLEAEQVSSVAACADNIEAGAHAGAALPSVGDE